MQAAHEKHRRDQDMPLAGHRFEPRRQTHQYKDESHGSEEYLRDVGDADLCRDGIEPPGETKKKGQQEMGKAHE